MSKAEFVLERFKESREWISVTEVAALLEDFIKNNQEKIDELNMPGNSSHGIEKIFEPILVGLEFSHEPSSEYPDRPLCPDFVNQKLGIIVEVERGKILQNNMDMLDFWKTHIHKECRYLILLVPKVLAHSEKSREKPFERVKKRLGPFFEKTNETNVRGLVLLGY